MSSSKKRPSFLKLPQEYLTELFPTSSNENCQETCESEPRPKVKMDLFNPALFEGLEDFVGKRPTTTNSKKLLPPSRHRRSGNVYQLRRSTISRRSTIATKEINKKNINSINTFLYKTKKEDKVEQTKMSKKILDALEIAVKPNARKELFRIPEIRSRYTSKFTTKTSRGTYFQSPKCARGTIDESPLLDIEKAEVLLKKKSYIRNNPFKTEPAPQTVFHPKTEIVVSSPSTSGHPKTEIVVSSPSTSGTTITNEMTEAFSNSDSEFEKLEKEYDEEELENITKKVERIRGILKEEQENARKFEEARNRRLLEITKILNEIDDDLGKTKSTLMNITNKNLPNKVVSKKSSGVENNLPTPKRSLKLKTSKTPVSTKKLLTASPLISSNRANNLRINVLKSNIAKSKYENNTPKVQKAQKMYNNLREAFSILETPKFNSNGCDKIPKSSGTTNISVKLQEQCLMLLGTPKH